MRVRFEFMIFSIVIPTFNRRAFLEKCLAAVFALDFPKEKYEVIVVDDGSVDGTKVYLNSLNHENLRVFFKNHGGPARARNFGVQNSLGKYIAFTDDDCLVPKDWLTKLEASLNKWPDSAAVGGYLEAPTEMVNSKIAARLESFETREIYKAGDCEYLGGFESPTGGTNNITYRRDIFLKLGGFDENFPGSAGEDADLKMRTVKAGYKFGYIPIKVIHLDPYSFMTFLIRSVRYGVGSAYFEKKHFNKVDTPSNLVAKLTIALGNLSYSAISLNKLSIARYLREIFMIYGRAKLILQI